MRALVTQSFSRENLLLRNMPDIQNICDERVTADAMVYLDRALEVASQGNTAQKLREHLVRIFYERGFCVSVAEGTRKIDCPTCHGTGYDDRYGCIDCRGSGIERVERFFVFTFTISGQNYRWHLPADRATFIFKVTDEKATAYSSPDPLELTEKSAYDQNEALVYAYLRHAGIPVWNLPLSSFARQLVLRR